jgi:uncharacterized OB-fold protein
VSNRARDGAYDDLLDAIDAGEGYYLACPEGHGWLPPRRVCPACGARELVETPLPETGIVLTHTTVSVATPGFSEDTPYVTAIAEFDAVRLTGLLRGVEPKSVKAGLSVELVVGERETTADRAVVFRPH